MSENSDKYRKAVAGFSSVIEAVPSDKWDAPSPCDGWTARHVVGHIIGGTGMISQVQTGEAPAFGDPAEVAGSDPAGKYAAVRDVALSALTPENLAKTVQSPMGEMPLDQMISMFMTADVVIHTWDLAKAAGIDVKLDPELVDQVYNQLVPIDAMIRMPNVFGPKVEPPAGADAQTTLICFVGRQP
jgi:uncharacterized protein (TIGR03086 family)